MTTATGRGQFRALWLGLECAATVTLVLLIGAIGVVRGYGYPINLKSLTLLALVVFSAAVIAVGAIRFSRLTVPARLMLSIFIPLAALYCLCYPRVYLADIRSGRLATESILGLRFARPGPNTKLVEHYLGFRKPVWEVTSVAGMNDSGRPVIYKALVFQERLDDLVNALPNDEARRHVLSAISDEQNLARLHQEMLLAIISEAMPRKKDSLQKWWERTRNSFASIHDPRMAVEATYGWTDAVADWINQRDAAMGTEYVGPISESLRVARMQEMGIQGGSEQFAQEYQLLKGSIGRDSSQREPPQTVADTLAVFGNPQR